MPSESPRLGMLCTSKLTTNGKHFLILIQKLGSNWVFGFILMADHHMLSAYLLEMPHSCWGCNDGNVILDFDLGSHMGIQDKCGGAFLKSYFISVLMMEFH
ncbi:unnamed protein product [Prunus armeniaca]|uniref:Uncharacterized protein n=1 Tax=Prunus armeniaca TaxID=36596 RepID=A0A6J5VY34_PRUAR|nr:unnamed protein product [Prunus armeniaca]